MPAGVDGNRNPIVTPERTAVIADVVNQITTRRQPGKPMLVAVDGIDGAERSTLADDVLLARGLAERLGVATTEVHAVVDQGEVDPIATRTSSLTTMICQGR